MDLEKRVQQIAENISDIVKFGKENECDDNSIELAIIKYTKRMLFNPYGDENIYFGCVPFSFNTDDGTIIPF